MSRCGALVRRAARTIVPSSWRSYWSFIRSDSATCKDLPMRTKLAMWRKGFCANRYYHYNLRENSTRLYLSDYFNVLTHPKNGWFTHLIDNKLYIPFWLKDFPEHVPQYYFVLTDRRVIALTGDRVVRDKTDSQALDAVLDVIEQHRCIGKPLAKSCGAGVAVLEKRSDGFFRNNRPCSREQLKCLLQSERNYLISEYVQQHAYAAALNSSTTNTLRILTCWDVEENVPFAARSFHRVGRPGMYGADNGALGGLIVLTELPQGRLGRMALIQEGRVAYCEEHPDTGVPVSGAVIPHFQEVLSRILDICRTVCFVPYIAWDIVVTEDSFKVLEVNSNTDVYGYQLFEPLLSDPRLQKFYGQFAKGAAARYFMR